MAIDGKQLYESSQLTPAMLGETIVDPDGGATFSEKEAAAIAWLDSKILPIADAEVSIPLLEVTGFDNVADFVNLFSTVGQATRNGWIAKGVALYDGAVLSFGRSEAMKSVASSASSFDRDSDQDRIQGNARRKALLDWARSLLAANGTPSDASDDAEPAPNSHSAPMIVQWW